MSTQVDSYRPPYGRVVEDFPRRAVFIGTTNDDDYLPEPNRREWPVHVTGPIDVAGVERDRDQLWAEAVAEYKAGTQWWLVGSAEQDARAQARLRGTPSPRREQVLDWYLDKTPAERPRDVTVHEIADRACGVPRERAEMRLYHEIGHAMKELGFTKHRGRRADVQYWFYRAPAALLESPHQAGIRVLGLVPNEPKEEVEP